MEGVAVMLTADTGTPHYHYWTGGEHNRFLTSFFSPVLQEEIRGFSIGMVILPPHSSSDLHTHEKTCETWYVVSGTGRITIGDETAELYPGLLIYGPPGVAHQLFNDSIDTVLKALLILNPDGDEREVLQKAVNMGTGE